MIAKLTQQIRASAFLRHNFIFLVGSVAVGVLNYAYYPILSRLLDIEAYGEVQAIVSLFLQLNIFLAVLGQVTVNVVANYKNDTDRERVIYELEKLGLYISIAGMVVVALFGWKLKSFFNFTSVWPFIVVMLAVVASVPLAFRSAFLRGHKKFGAVSLANVYGAVFKIILSAGLVWIGWSTVGAIFGLVIAQLIAFGYAAAVARKIGFTHPDGVSFRSLPNWKVLAPEVRYGLLVLCGSLTVTILSSVDIFVVKHFFDAATAGRYAGVSTVARMIFFLTASVVQVLLPSVKMHAPAQQNRNLLIKSLAMVIVLGGATWLLFVLFANKIIAVLMGHAFTTYAHLLGKLSLAMLVISVLNLAVSYFVALRRYGVAIVVIVGAGITAALLALYHQTLDDIVSSLLYGSTSMLALLALWNVITNTTNRMREGDGIPNN
jgi:O-antigen/teichoic acid export membrane protein